MSATTLSVFSTTCAARTAGWALSGSSTDALNIDRSIPRFAAVYITRDLHRFSHMLRQLCSIGVRGKVEFVGGTGCICDRVIRVGAAQAALGDRGVRRRSLRPGLRSTWRCVLAAAAGHPGLRLT